MDDIGHSTDSAIARPLSNLRLRHVALLAVVTVAILFARRPDQFLHPYIWVEEGKYVLRAYLETGAWILTMPLAGYEQFISRVIALASFKGSILYAPEIALILTVLFTFGVIAAVAFSPTKLRWPFACAVATLLIPSDAETFAVSSYAFWWAGILLLLAVLWDADRGYAWLRWVFILIGGLSSPIIAPVWALLILRAVVERRRSEFLVAAIAVLPVVAQLLGMRQQGLVVSPSFGIDLVVALVQKFVGAFWFAKAGALWGFAALALLVSAIWIVRDSLDRYFYLLLATFAAISIGISFRMPVESLSVINPIDVAPRYFFYPFILLGWILIWVASVAPLRLRLAIGAAFAVALLVVGAGLSRRHDAVDWKANMLACASSPSYDLTFHYIGSVKEMWSAPFTGDECKALIARSLF